MCGESQQTGCLCWLGRPSLVCDLAQMLTMPSPDRCQGSISGVAIGSTYLNFPWCFQDG